MKNFYFLFILALFLGYACTEVRQIPSDPLPSWNDVPAKQAIMDFVALTTSPESADFIHESDRIVVFDNDGTLWSEQPYYFQFAFAFDMVRMQVADHPEWKEQQPYKGVLENDLKAAMESGEEGLLKLLLATHTGMSNAAFKQTVSNWIDTARHDISGRLYREMVFQPMLEVLEYFRANGFKTYIVSGGTTIFMQTWTESLYGIPPEQVIGSRFKLSYEWGANGPLLFRQPEFTYLNDGGGKPVSIAQLIGKRPVAAFGNSDGDLAMLQYTAAGKGKRLSVYIHHTDAEREYAYDRESTIGKLDKGLEEASKRGWTVVDMKTDWNRIYPN